MPAWCRANISRRSKRKLSPSGAVVPRGLIRCVVRSPRIAAGGSKAANPKMLPTHRPHGRHQRWRRTGPR
jgi:hypothetical protein